MVCGGCRFPIEGIFGFVCHSGMWKTVCGAIVAFVVFSMAATVCLFKYTYQIQKEKFTAVTNDTFLDHLPAWLDAVIVVGFMLLEVLVLTLTVFKLLFNRTQHKIIQTVLQKSEATQRSLLDDSDDIDGTWADSLTGMEFRTLVQIAVMVITMPVNILFGQPWGLIVWIFANAWLYTFNLVSPYLSKLGLSDGNSGYAKAHACSFTLFGAAALGLTVIPFVGMFFEFTNAYGAGLYLRSLYHEKEGMSCCWACESGDAGDESSTATSDDVGSEEDSAVAS
eukprot:TRINITY_DN3349_c0_g3_i1.p1 TRINITY_DN3349_c0_g3~~TRINITY_DN3349_c0_g3_i1.p1  ORF type:complete len:280 (+),score=27.27 TRINITY_DN3349_c0_g3_i1:76-915(+)